jgi:hypothetical protein
LASFCILLVSNYFIVLTMTSASGTGKQQKKGAEVREAAVKKVHPSAPYRR